MLNWLECFDIMWISHFMKKIFYFFPYLKDFVLVNKTFYFKLVRILRFDNMSYTMLLLLFNWYYWTLSIGINFDLFVYSYVYCVCMLSVGIIYWWLVLILFHTHTHVLFVLLYFYILSTNLVFARAWTLFLFQLIYFSIGILFQAYA